MGKIDGRSADELADAAGIPREPMTVHLDEVYMIVNRDTRKGIIYAAPANSAQQAWANALEVYGDPPPSREYMLSQGWRAKKIRITLGG